MLGCHVDALDPPELAVSPLAPLAGEHERGDDSPIDFHDEGATTRGIREEGRDAGAQGRDVEVLVLGLARHGAGEVDEDVAITLLGGAHPSALQAHDPPSSRVRSAAATAAAASTMPAPQESGPSSTQSEAVPVGNGRAVCTSRSWSSPGRSAGRTERTSAATPLTIGAAMLVPTLNP